MEVDRVFESNRYRFTHTVVLMVAALSAIQAHAQVYSNITMGGPTWTRPQADGSSVSAVTVPYRAMALRVSTSGNFSFTAETHGTFDNMEFLYNSSFNPSIPLTGFLRGVNAVGFGGTEIMSAITLTSNTLYYVVTTGFNSSDSGPYTLTFSGPSSVTQLFPPSLSGDYNRDGTVNGADYVLWRRTLNTSVTFFSAADGNGSGTIDSGDFDVWRANFGQPPGSGSSAVAIAAVPEPATAVPLMLGAVGWCLCRRRTT
jgi:Dockerin type I domain